MVFAWEPELTQTAYHIIYYTNISRPSRPPLQSESGCMHDYTLGLLLMLTDHAHYYNFFHTFLRYALIQLDINKKGMNATKGFDSQQ